MAEARAEEDEERLREPARRRAEHSDRNKPDQRHSSQGPLSSIRAVIKRTSRTSPQSEHQRERSRRPEITILSAEPLPSNTWFPGASGAFPPAPPPAPPTWAAGPTAVQLPPPSYEQVIREKSREQSREQIREQTREQSREQIVSPSSSSASARLSTSTIATQTDTHSPGPQSSAARPARRPPKPPRPSPPSKLESERELKAHPEPRDSLQTQCGVQTDFDDIIDEATPTDSTPAVTPSDLEPTDPIKARPRPRPRSRISLPDRPTSTEVKVQTLVRLKDSGTESVFAGFDDSPSNISSKYMQDLLEVFGSDETHVPQEQSQQSEATNVEEEEEENTAACAMKTSEPLTRPQPRPRTQKSKPQLIPKASVFEVFDTQEAPVDQSPPVPAPRPLLNKLQSPDEFRSSSAPPDLQGAAAAAPSSERRHSDDHTINTVMKTDGNAGKRPSVPRHSRPPPPAIRKTLSASQVPVDVSRSSDASVPPLPPRPSGGRPLPLRPPPIKVTKPAGSSSSPAATNQLPGSRVSRRAPPLPPRPKPGHPLYKRYTSKAVQEVEEEDISKEQEEPAEETSVQEEELLIVLDDAHVPQAQSNTLHDPAEVKGQDVAVHEEVVTPEQQIQQDTQNRLVVGRFAFDGEEGELSFNEGDVITVVEYVNEEWGRGSLNGRTGIFPLSFIQSKEENEPLPGKPTSESPAPPAGRRIRGRALYDFTPESEDELCLKAGDVVCDLEDVDAEWFVGEFGGKRGIVPKSFIEELLEALV